MLEWISLTVSLLGLVLSVILTKSWEMGRDYVVVGNKGKKLNLVEKFIDGFYAFLKA